MTELPASAKLTSIFETLSAATSLLCGWSSAAEKTIHLPHNHLKHLLTSLVISDSSERVSCSQNTVSVDTRLAVQTVPDERRQVEQNRLHRDRTGLS